MDIEKINVNTHLSRVEASQESESKNIFSVKESRRGDVTGNDSIDRT